MYGENDYSVCESTCLGFPLAPYNEVSAGYNCYTDEWGQYYNRTVEWMLNHQTAVHMLDQQADPIYSIKIK